MKRIPNISGYLQDVDNILQVEFIQAITGEIKCSEKERKFGLSVPIFTSTADFEFDTSRNFTAEIQKNIIEHTRTCMTNVKKIKQLKNEIKSNERHTLLKDIRKYIN